MAKLIERAAIRGRINDRYRDALLGKPACTNRKETPAPGRTVRKNADLPRATLKQHSTGRRLCGFGVDKANRDIGTGREFLGLDLPLGRAHPHDQRQQPYFAHDKPRGLSGVRGYIGGRATTLH